MLDRIYRWIMPDSVDVMPQHSVSRGQRAYQLYQELIAAWERHLYGLPPI